MIKYLLCFVLLALTACAGEDGAVGPQGPAAPSPVVTAFEADVASLLNDENVYRLGLGQSVLTSGLSCTLYTFTGGDRIQSSIAGHNTLSGLSNVSTFLLTSTFNQPDTPISVGLNIMPMALRSVYKNMYMVRCQGQIVVTQTMHYVFDLASDDASVLYINGSKVIDNDNNHGTVNISGMKYLRRGVHTFRLDYAQAGGGNQSLILKMNGSLLNPQVYAH